MWVIAGILLGLVVLVSLLGFHSGPHLHATAGVIGGIGAAWLVLMAVDGRSAPLLWALLVADLVVSAGVGFLAWKGLRASVTAGPPIASLEGTEGVAVTDLVPAGIVRVHGEQWSASSVNGTVRAGTRVQVLRAGGVRLDVWGEESEAALPGDLVGPAPGEPKEQST